MISVPSVVTKDTVADVFNKLDAYFVNIKLRKGVTKVAKVDATVYNAIVDSGLSTTAKGSEVDKILSGEPYKPPIINVTIQSNNGRTTCG